MQVQKQVSGKDRWKRNEVHCSLESPAALDSSHNQKVTELHSQREAQESDKHYFLLNRTVDQPKQKHFQHRRLWVACLLKLPTLGLGLGSDLRVLRSISLAGLSTLC